MKVVLGFDRNITQCHWSPSPAVVIIHISSGQYPEHTVECVYEYCFVLFSQFEKFIGSINTFQFGAVLQMIFVILLPSPVTTLKSEPPLSTVTIHIFLSLSPLSSVYLLWTLLIVILIFVRLSGTICYGALFLFINNSVTFDKLGAVNGLGTTLTALFRYGWKGIDTYGS